MITTLSQITINFSWTSPLNEVEKSTLSKHQAILHLYAVLCWGMEKLEPAFEDTKNTLNNIACLCMSEIE
jgi:hypothetical protein